MTKENETPEVQEDEKETTLGDMLSGTVEEAEDNVETAPEDDAVQDEPEAKDEDKEEPPATEEDEKAIKQKAYRERQEQKRRKAEEARQAELQAQANSAVDLTQKPAQGLDEEAIKAKLRQEAIDHDNTVRAAKRELRMLEKEFVDAFPDYEAEVNAAMEATKLQLVSEGHDEEDVVKYLEHRKLMIANDAVIAGLDPVEVVYKEARLINQWVDSVAEQRGYVKAEAAKPKTNLQAIREMSKPAAVGTGRGTGAAKKTFDELGDDDMDEIDAIPLGDILSGRY